jgi:acetyltransferase-like isoleucine patch superfamily enzyme
MNIWQRHGFITFPFVALAAIVRRGLEELRLVYWRHVFGWKIGKGVRVALSTHISRRIKVDLGDGVSIGRNCEVFSEILNAKFEMGRDSDIARGCMLEVSGGLKLGDSVTISEGVVIYTHSHGLDPRSPPKYFSVLLEDRVWICTRAIVLATAKIIGARAVIAPYAVVRKTVPAGYILKACDDQQNHAQPPSESHTKI